MSSETRVVLVYHGVEIHADEDKMVCLNELWKAAGSPDYKDPRRWADTPSGKEFTEELLKDLSQNLNVVKNDIWKSRRGKHLGGTWAHRQIALAYAKYLSPAFHRFVNDAFIEWLEEKNDPDLKADRAIEGYRKQGLTDDVIEKRLKGKVRRNQFTTTLGSLGYEEGADFARVTDIMNREILGAPASEYKANKGLSPGARTRDYVPPSQLDDLSHAEGKASDILRQYQIRDKAIVDVVVKEIAKEYATASTNLESKFASRFGKSG